MAGASWPSKKWYVHKLLIDMEIPVSHAETSDIHDGCALGKAQ